MSGPVGEHWLTDKDRERLRRQDELRELDNEKVGRRQEDSASLDNPSEPRVGEKGSSNKE